MVSLHTRQPDLEGFYQAARQGDTEQIERFLQQGILINQTLEEEGPTALQLACFYEHKEVVQQLLTAGADPSIWCSQKIGNKDLPLSRFYMDGPLKAACIMNGLQEMSELIPDRDEIAAEYLSRKRLAHIYSIKGISQLQGHEMNLEGFRKFIPHQLIAKTLQSRQMEPILATAFQKTTVERSKAEIVQDIQAGELVILPARWKKHAIDLVFYQQDFVICNRGFGVSSAQETLRYFQLDPMKVTTPLLTAINNMATVEAEIAVNFFYRQLPNMLKREVPKAKSLQQQKDLQLDSILKRVAPRLQKVGNCTFASAKAAYLVSLVLLRIAGKLIPADHVEKVIKEIRCSYKMFFTELRQVELDAYLSRKNKGLEIDEELLKKCEQKLDKYSALTSSIIS